MNWSSACCHSPTIAAPPINFLAMAIMSIDDLRSLYTIQLERLKNVIAMMKPDDERGLGSDNFGPSPSSRPHNWSWKKPQSDARARPVSFTASISALLCTG
jgi:hypothetical protein